jgi:hypothetical protein
MPNKAIPKILTLAILAALLDELYQELSSPDCVREQVVGDFPSLKG